MLPRSSLMQIFRWRRSLFYKLVSLAVISSMLLRPVTAVAVLERAAQVAAHPRARVERVAVRSLAPARVSPHFIVDPSAAGAVLHLPAPRLRTSRLADPTPSGALPVYPPNHILDGAYQLTGTPPANYDFATPSSLVGTPPPNHDLTAAQYDIGAPPTNHNFETGNLSGWTTAGTVTLQNDATHGYWAQLGANGILTSDAFTVDASAQQAFFDLGYIATNANNRVEIYVLSGAGYATETKLADPACNNCGAWVGYGVDLSAYLGQSIKVKFKRLSGTIGIDVVRAVVLLPNYSTSGVFERGVEAGGNVAARLGKNGVMTSAAFTVDGTTQAATVQLTGLTTLSDQYRIEVLSGPTYSTVTQVAAGSVSDVWQPIQFALTTWLGQSIKLRISSIYILGRIGVDDVGLQHLVAPNWQVVGDVYRLDESGNYYFSTNGDLVSSAFTLATDVQQITLRHRGGSAGAAFFVKLLRGANFGEEIDLAGSVNSSTSGWQTLKIALNLYAGETVKLKLDHFFGRLHYDDVAIGEILLPGWQPVDLSPFATGEDSFGSYVTSATGGAITLRSQPVGVGLVDGAAADTRYYAVAYDIGQGAGSLARVYWVNEQGQSWTVFQKAADMPTGYQVGYFPVGDFMGARGHFRINTTQGGKIYSIADNIARQQLNEPFSYKVGIQIDTATGSFGYQAPDLSTAGVMPLNFSRYYNGHSDRLGALGYAWSHTYETRLAVTDDGDAGVVFGAGKEIFFDWNPNSQTFAPADPRIHDELVKNGDGSYTFTTKANQKYQFTAAGVLSSIQDPNNNAITLLYNGSGQLTSIVAQGGATLTLAYNGSGRLVSVTDPLGAVVSFAYDANGDLVSATRPDGGVEQYSYNRHRLTQVVDATGHTLFQNSFDNWHRVVQQTDALNKTLTIQYGVPAAGVTSVTDPEGGVSRYYFDQQQRTTDWVAPTSQTTSYLYDANGNLQRVIDGGAGQWNFGYDANGNLLTGQDPLGNPTQFTYNPEHLPTTITDGNGNVTTLVYDVKGNLLQKTDALGHVIVYTYNAAGNMTSMTNPLGQTESYTYDAAGNRLTRTDPMGHVWQWSYDAANRLKTETDPLGHTTTYTYDLLGRRTEIKDHLNNRKRFFYDLAGRLLAADDELGRRTLWDYDERGLSIAKTDPAGKVTTYTYDDNRNMTAVTDPLGHTTSYEYDASNRLTKITQPNGAATQYSYDGNGRLIGEIDPLGRITSYSYNSAGRLTGRTLPNGAVYTYLYDANGNLTQTTDPLGRSSSFGYDAANRRISMTDAANFVTTFAYDAADRQTQVTNPLGAVTTRAYDAAGRLTALTDALGHVTTYSYDAAGNQVSSTDPLGRVRSTAYDALNRVATTTDPMGNVTTYSYDAAGQLTQITAPNGATTVYAYDVRGLQTSETDALNHVTSYSYDNAGRMTQMTDAAAQSTTHSYDAAGRLIGVTDALGHTTTYTYDAAGNRTAVTDPLGQTQTTSYNVLNRPVAQTDAGGNTTQMSYDLAGQLLQTLSPSGRVTSYGYDARGLMISETDALGRAELYEYNAAGRRTKVTDRRGAATLFSYDAAGRMQSMTDALNSSVQFTYDAGGQLTALTNPLGKITGYTYDVLGNKLTQTDPLGRVQSYSYDQYGRLASKTDARGITASYAYDLLNRLTSVTYPGGVNSYSYDLLDRIAAVTDPTGTTSFSYDALSRVTAIAAPQGTASYTYNAVGQRSSMTLPGNRVVNYSYHPTGRVASITDWLGGTQNFSYDADGQLTAVARPNNVTSNYGYDLAGRLNAISHTGSGGVLQQYGYTLDENGNRVAVVTPGGTENYTLDALSRLTQVAYPNGDTASYSYDANGNRISQTVNGVVPNYSYDDAGQLLSDGATSYSYDANGNLTSAGVDTYTWDWANRLTAANVGGNSATYSYDAFDVRVGATVNGAASSYLWDRLADYPQLVDDGSSAYIYNGGPLAQIDASGNRHYLLTDALNSVRGLTDNSGSLVGAADYAAFGAIRSQTGITSKLGFTGELFSAATGLLHLRARELMPNLGRFLSADSVQPNAPGTQGYNLYAYAANNPTTWTDPSGHFVAILPLLQILFLIFLLFAFLIAYLQYLKWLREGGADDLADALNDIGDTILDTVNDIPDTIDELLDGLGDAPGNNPDDDPQQNWPTPVPIPVPTPDDEDRRRVFISGNNHLNVTYHIRTAIFFQAPTTLHKVNERDTRSWWYNEYNHFYQSDYDPPGVGNRCWIYKGSAQRLGIACDEYPFGSTREGGERKRPSLEPLDASENSSHGNALEKFYSACNVDPSDGRGGKFEVVTDLQGPTRSHCPEYGIDGKPPKP